MRAAHLPMSVWWVAVAVGVVADLVFWLPLRPPGKARLKAGVSAVTGLAFVVGAGVVGGYPPQAMVPGCAALLLLAPLSVVGHRTVIKQFALEYVESGRVAAGAKVPVALMAQVVVVLLAAAGAAVWLVEDAARSV
ncbi:MULTISPECIES: hypothetical protein [Streptomyces]|uniref:hypothetical protein n=1 Tax=Streptomyces TaxID=1883 RepID=UPI00163C92DA|nr:MULTISPECIES: hypothetical protein [Streptomyces]MBC2876872.1 hypothetical protein [Streptomyces sp. TYQ1024]UBI35903.1 hypothetical protein K7I03_05115 [Streptomyces mobaraensis]UKW28497.1 hypothetical protein MCU78_05115 [Streptomyces sp. TYQ1024]